MTALTRFAPSPTGHLHVGNARIALVNWLCARKLGGRFLLRMDDTDTERSTDAFAESIEHDLAWLGLNWDDFARQSDRTERYDAAASRLKESCRLYPCYETPEELSLKRKAQLSAGRPPIYDRSALKLSDADREAFESDGRHPHWRLLLEPGSIDWEDLVRGSVHFTAEDLSDPVLIREDGRPLYTLSSVVDDLELAITHIIRGEDHVANTATQVQLFEALGGTAPVFGHLSLLADAEGKGLSKRLGSLSLGQLRDDGIEPEAVNSLLARLGSSQPVEPIQSVQELIDAFDIGKFSRATPKFDPEILRSLNARLLHERSYSEVLPRLQELGFNDLDESFWMMVRGNLEVIEDVRHWWAVCNGTIDPVVEDQDYTVKASALLPPAPFADASWKTWTEALKAETGRKGRELFLPLRLALTGRAHGPEMGALLPEIGYDRAKSRLLGQSA